jgi:hypothetical protein
VDEKDHRRALGLRVIAGQRNQLKEVIMLEPGSVDIRKAVDDLVAGL